MTRECITHHICDCMAERLKQAEAERDLQEVSARKYRSERDALRTALSGVVGLVELVASRDDLPCGLDDLMLLSHRMTDARAALAAKGE